MPFERVLLTSFDAALHPNGTGPEDVYTEKPYLNDARRMGNSPHMLIEIKFVEAASDSAPERLVDNRHCASSQL
jgi:hypothetical protein